MYVHENNNEGVEGLSSFLKNWDEEYKAEAKTISLFDPLWVKSWSKAQKIFFAKAFYHARGHFHDFLWYLGNFAPNVKYKKIILENIQEEFGKEQKSHEHFYLDFAKELGQDLKCELLNEETYLNCIKIFNKQHLQWIMEHEWISSFAAFSAYERLDNIDYVMLLELAKNIGVGKNGLSFFAIHVGVKHYSATEEALRSEWGLHNNQIQDAFKFIAQNQIKMWKNLSRAIYEYTE